MLGSRLSACLRRAAVLALYSLALCSLAGAETKFLKDDTPERAKWRALREVSDQANATPVATPPKAAAPDKEKGILQSAKESLTVTPSYGSATGAGGLSAGMDIPVTIGGGQDKNATKKTAKTSDPLKVHVRPEGAVDTKGGGTGGVGITLPF